MSKSAYYVRRKAVKSLLRIELVSGKIIGEREGSFDIRYDVDGGYATYRIYADASNNPFSPEIFSGFTLSDALY